MLHAPGFNEIDFSGLKVTLGGGMAVQAAVAERWKEATGNVLTQAWGLTETSPAACINPTDVDFNGSIGLPISSTEIAIKDDAGNDLAIGQIGEICVRGPQVMQGYWNRPDETAKVMLPGGWLRTGDVGRMDARGFVYIEDRKKDMILVSGFNVYPNEVEAVAVDPPGHPGGRCRGAARRALGRGRRALRCAQGPEAHREGRHRATAANRWPATRCRNTFTFRAELPKTNVGKILRKALREELPKSSDSPPRGA